MDRISTPRNERSRRTRASILDATWRLLEERGAGAVTIEAVAERAGVSRRAVYLHFASRSELISALHEHVDQVLDLESSIRPVIEAPDAAAALDEMAAHLARYHPKILAIDRAVDMGRRSDPDLRPLWDRGMRAWHAGCLQLMGQLAEEGRLAAPWTVSTAADMLLALMRDDVIETLVVERGWPERRLARLLALLLRRTFVAGDCVGGGAIPRRCDAVAGSRLRGRRLPAGRAPRAAASRAGGARRAS